MRRFWKLRREVSHGGTVPPGWRFAWYEPHRRVAVYYPMPLHRVMRAARELAQRVRLAWDAAPTERRQVFEMHRIHRERQRLAEEYSRGYLIGWQECFRTCIEIVEDELTRPSDLLEISGFVIDPAKLPEGN